MFQVLKSEHVSPKRMPGGYQAMGVLLCETVVQVNSDSGSPLGLWRDSLGTMQVVTQDKGRWIVESSLNDLNRIAAAMATDGDVR